MRGLCSGYLDSAFSSTAKVRVAKTYNASNFDTCFHNTESKTKGGLTLWAFHDDDVDANTIPVDFVMTCKFRIKGVPKSVDFQVESVFFGTIFLVLHNLDNPETLAVFNPPI